MSLSSHVAKGFLDLKNQPIDLIGCETIEGPPDLKNRSCGPTARETRLGCMNALAQPKRHLVFPRIADHSDLLVGGRMFGVVQKELVE